VSSTSDSSGGANCEPQIKAGLSPELNHARSSSEDRRCDCGDELCNTRDGCLTVWKLISWTGARRTGLGFLVLGFVMAGEATLSRQLHYAKLINYLMEQEVSYLFVLFFVHDTSSIPSNVGIVVNLGLGTLSLFLWQLGSCIHVHVENHLEATGRRPI
jgi:hypothetical protein